MALWNMFSPYRLDLLHGDNKVVYLRICIFFLLVPLDTLILSHCSWATRHSFDFGLLYWSTHSFFGAPTILLEPPFAVLIPSMPPPWVFNYLLAFLSPSNPLNLSCEMHTILSRHAPFEVNGDLQTTIKK